MNKRDFIKKLMDLYPDTFKPERFNHYQSWFGLYEVTIGNHWDYDKLMKIFAKEYKSVVTPPHPSFFKDYASDVRLNVKVEKVLSEKQKQEIREDLEKVTDALSACNFIGKYGDYTDENHPEEVIEVMEKYGFTSYSNVAEWQHDYFMSIDE